ncbi:unnamed protein product, partial [Linum tenue]
MPSTSYSLFPYWRIVATLGRGLRRLLQCRMMSLASAEGGGEANSMQGGE